MPRKNVPISTEHPYHLVARFNNRECFARDLDLLWTITENHLYFISKAHGMVIHAYVLMSNHFHLLASTPEGNISKCMHHFMRETSIAVAELTGRINHIWGDRYFPSLITNQHHFSHAYKYVLRNPVKAKICQRVEEYPYSTLYGLLGRRHLFIPTIDTYFSSDLVGTLKWLNQPPLSEYEMTIQKALSKKMFILPRNKKSGHVHDLERNLF